jgi:hypothetical protein
MRQKLSGLGLLAVACTHLTPFSPRALIGQTVPLRPGWSMTLALDGQVGGRPAVVRLAVEEPHSRVSEGCFESPPEVLARVGTGAEVARVDGGPTQVPFQEAVVARDVQIGSRTLGDVRALRDGGERCELTLGSEVLIGFVLEVNPGARTVTFHGATPAASRFQAEDSVVLELTRDPTTDRPSLAAQLDTGGLPLTLPMRLTTGSAAVEISADAARLLSGADARGGSFALESLALAPDWVLHHATASVMGGADTPGQDEGALGSAPRLFGILGADAWGHYRILLNLREQRLVLYRRPPPVEGRSGPESWMQLSSDSAQTGSLVRLISWQTLDRGARVPLEPSHVRLVSCRIGLTLRPEDPGASLEVAVPWPELERGMPECARELARVPAWTGELETSGPRPCSGTCLYAQELSTGRTVCSCEARPLTELTPTQRLKPPAQEEPEPKDPVSPSRPAPRH